LSLILLFGPQFYAVTFSGPLVTVHASAFSKNQKTLMLG
jgi:hypothetical protein